MKIVFIRHGEPDKSYVDERGFIGQGRDLAPLSTLGVNQAKQVSYHPLLEGGRRWETISEIISRSKPVFR